MSRFDWRYNCRYGFSLINSTSNIFVKRYMNLHFYPVKKKKDNIVIWAN